MNRARVGLIAAVVLAAAGTGTGLALAAAGGGSPAPAPATASQPVGAATPSGIPGTDTAGGPGYSWYRSAMGRYYGRYFGPGMMGGSPYGWMMGQGGFRWMLGGTVAPGWERGGSLPGFMMGGADPGTVMGRLFADAPGPRVSAAQAARLGAQAPADAQVDRAARAITFTTRTVRLVVLASPSMPAENFRIAGTTNPAITVPAGAQVTMELINADADMAHGLVITAAGAARSQMPMMTAAPAFPGAALWLLGQPTAAGMHAATLSFTASAPGSYQYLCPVPGHAEEGMAGSFAVTGPA
ncbi:MAG TPA: sulfocyanin-like copper-binding protein [Streptosporangiaceae bacterium]|nr:sulfocyanin-like copper-binding protein [Streptosporangiaceae bacterium]